MTSAVSCSVCQSKGVRGTKNPTPGMLMPDVACTISLRRNLLTRQRGSRLTSNVRQKYKMKPIGYVLALFALWFAWSSIGVIVDKSDHMGSRVRNAERWGQWELRLKDTSLSPDEQKYWLLELRNLRNNGIKGYDLLWDTTIKLGVASFIMSLGAVFVLRSKRQNKRNEN